MAETKPFEISKSLVWEAYKRVKANKGAPGIDGETLALFEDDLKSNLYKIWNRMSSGSYIPPAVLKTEIPKGDGTIRSLGIPTVSDRVAQMVAKMTLEPLVEPKFHRDSYGYRPRKSALDAVEATRKRCWRKDWVIDLDIKDFFGSIDHQLMMKAVAHHTDLKWLKLYIERWLKAPILKSGDEFSEERHSGTPQGGVISPLLANLYMHYAFDLWMEKKFPPVLFERYADDIVIHCRSRAQAEYILKEVRKRLLQCSLELHPEKTKIVYCKDAFRLEDHEQNSFDFLGYEFRPREAKSREGKLFVTFSPAISPKSAKAIREHIRKWNLVKGWNTQDLESIAKFVNPVVRGWLTYYGRFNRSICFKVIAHLNLVLGTWAKRRFKRFNIRWSKAFEWLSHIAKREKYLFVHWELGVIPTVRR